MSVKNGASILEQIITGADLAALTGHSERTIKRLTVQGIVKLAHDSKRRTLKNRYVAGDACPRVCEYLRDQVLVDDPDEVLYRSARARKMAALAMSEEMRVKLQRGQLLDGELVDREVMMILRSLRDNLRGIPAQLMHQLRAMDDPVLINKTLKDAIDGVLRKTADGDISAKLRRELRRRHRVLERERDGEATSPDA